MHTHMSHILGDMCYERRHTHNRGLCGLVCPSPTSERGRRRRPPGGYTTAACSGGRRDPFSTDTESHTHTVRSLACPLLTLSSSARPFSNGIFKSNGAPASLPHTSSSFTYIHRIDSFWKQNANQLGALAGLSFLAVYVGVAECSLTSLPPASSSLTSNFR
jgi:hypothetical protein